MAAKGTIIKEEITLKLLEALPNSFRNEKEIRVDTVENGSPVQIKITLTAVKSPILNSPESQIINEEHFSISDDEKKDLTKTLEELGVTF